MKRLSILIFVFISVSVYGQYDPLNVPQKDIDKKFGKKQYEHPADYYKSKAQDAALFAGVSAIIGGASYYMSVANIIADPDNSKILKYTGHGFSILSIGALIYANINYANYKDSKRYSKSQFAITSNGFKYTLRF